MRGSTPAGDQYNLLGLSRAEGRMREFNIFASDSWRASPSLTVSAGVRYVLAESRSIPPTTATRR